MKSSDFADLLIKFSDVSASVGSAEVASSWAELAALFALPTSKKSGDVCKLIANVSVPAATDRSVASLLSNLDSFIGLVQSVSKKEPSASLIELQKALVTVEACPLSDVVNAVKLSLTSTKPKSSKQNPQKLANQEVIDQLFDQLEASLGNERDFKAAHAHIQTINLPVADLKALAKKFTGSTAKNKDHALKLIWLRHTSLMESRAKDAAIGGRTAA